MAKVYPNAVKLNTPTATTSISDANSPHFTVWKKSLLFNCDGFTVLDAKGNLAFRVDNYGSSSAEVVLMDASGKPLQTIRRKRLSISVNWLLYDGEKLTNPIFSVRKHVSLLSNAKSCLAHVSTTSGNTGRLVYEIEGSYAKRCCVIYDSNRNRVAEIRQKEATVVGVAFGSEVFRLIILRPDLIDSSLAMSLVVLLDQMFGSPKH